MTNDIVIDERVGADPQDCPASVEKQRFCLLGVYTKPKSKEKPEWLTGAAELEALNLLHSRGTHSKLFGSISPADNAVRETQPVEPSL